CIAYSGRGLFQNNTGSTEGTTPEIYDRIFPDSTQLLWTAADRENFSPHYIVINLGSNDFYAETTLGSKYYVERSKFINAYIDFVTKLRNYYPHATIICTVGVVMSDNHPEGAQQWTRIQEYVQAVRNHFTENGDNKILYLKFEPHSAPYGEDWHPSIATHKQMAETLTQFIVHDMLTKKH
ncbi:MAG: GDSL-type esterase/lipase family protein, partial [Bacteroidales bacterium]|nr:GDSL-type esterase/lipase family protein [Bacteroidales bacterium]